MIYRVSEGVVLREHPDKQVEAFVKGAWIRYPGIDDDWLFNSRPATDAEVAGIGN